MSEQHSCAKPITQQRDLAKLPKALAPLIERPQWCVWRWTQRENGSWQKPPFQSLDPAHHASTKDPNTWSNYATALATVQAGHADGISYVLTEKDPFAAIDLDHCRDPATGSIDIWAQNFLDVARHTYSEVTPSGEGCRIWGLTTDSTDAVHKNFTLEIGGKEIHAELFRRTAKALTVTGYSLDRAIRGLASADKAFGWAIAWGERRKAQAAAEAQAAATQKLIDGCGFNGSGAGHDIEHLERLVREGVTNGANRSDTFHAIVGHYLGCGWSVERIDGHLRDHPDGIAGRYLGEGRLFREIERSANKYNASVLPLAEGWSQQTVIAPPRPTPSPPPPPQPQVTPDSEPLDPDDMSDPEPVREPYYDPGEPDNDGPDPEPDEEPDDGDPELEDGEDAPPQPDPKLPRLHAHGDKHVGPLKPWLIKHLLPQVGHGLLSGQWGTGKTFVVLDLAAALWTGQPFLGHVVKRQCGVLLIAAEGSSEVRLRLDAVVREKCGSTERAPFRWYEETPLLLQKDAAKTLIAMARQADDSLQAEFGLPLGLIVIDTVAACAGYRRSGDDNDSAVGQAVMNVLKAVAQAVGCFVLGVGHIGKNIEAGTKGTMTKEDASDVVWACLGERSISGSVNNTRLAVRKHRGGRDGAEHRFILREVEAPEPDEDGDPVTTMVVDWSPAGSPGGNPARPPINRWTEGCRPDQCTAMQRLEQVIMETMTGLGVDREIPPDGPIVRTIEQKIVREQFYRKTPVAEDDGKTLDARRKQFDRALARAERLHLVSLDEINGVACLWLRHPEAEA